MNVSEWRIFSTHSNKHLWKRRQVWFCDLRNTQTSPWNEERSTCLKYWYHLCIPRNSHCQHNRCISHTCVLCVVCDVFLCVQIIKWETRGRGRWVMLSQQTQHWRLCGLGVSDDDGRDTDNIYTCINTVSQSHESRLQPSVMFLEVFRIQGATPEARTRASQSFILEKWRLWYGTYTCKAPCDEYTIHFSHACLGYVITCVFWAVAYVRSCCVRAYSVCAWFYCLCELECVNCVNGVCCDVLRFCFCVFVCLFRACIMLWVLK